MYQMKPNQLLMGKGDKKSRRGKIILGTSVVKRNRKKNKKKEQDPSE